MWYSHKESGVAVDLAEVRLLSYSKNVEGEPCICFHFCDGKSVSEPLQNEEQRQEVFEGISEALKDEY